MAKKITMADVIQMVEEIPVDSNADYYREKVLEVLRKIK